MFALLKPSCAIYNYRYIFRVLLQDSTCCREFTVLHEDARILLHTTTAQLDVYASQVLQFLYVSQLTQFILLLLTILC